MPDARAPHDVCAIVVTYHPDRAIVDRLGAVRSQAGAVIVVDNASGAESLARLRDCASSGAIDLVCNERNRGVASALNQGAERARAAGFEWALLLDQDTVPKPTMTAALCRAANSHPHLDRVAVIGSNYVEVANGRELIAPGESRGWVDRATAITSGSLVSLPILAQLGGFRDELFIDEVDTDYCFRARARGYAVIVTTEVTMEHAIGDARRERRFLWRTVRPVNYSSTRWYYIARNTVVTAREHWRTNPAWVRENVFGHAKWLVKAMLYEPRRLDKLGSAIEGAWDGVRGRMGPRPEP